MPRLDFESIARAAEAAADLARRETLPRFRSASVEIKADGTPVTEADRAAERAIRAHLQRAFPDFAIRGEEYGKEGDGDGPCWLVDPIDGTIAFSRGIPLFTTLIALLPIMFGVETGTRVMQRIAAPMVGGLISSTVLTLVVLPAVYLLWKRRALSRPANEA